jgi:hypothetical protein
MSQSNPNRPNRIAPALGALIAAVFVAGACGGEKIQTLTDTQASQAKRVDELNAALDAADEKRGKLSGEMGKTKKTLADFEILMREAYPKQEEDEYPKDLTALVAKFLQGQELSVKTVEDEKKLRTALADVSLGKMQFVEVSTDSAKVHVVGSYSCEPGGGGNIGAAVSSFEAKINLRLVDGPQEKILDEIAEKTSSSGLSQAMACKSAVNQMVNQHSAGVQKKIGNVL